LWVASDACRTAVCKNTNMPAYPSANITLAGGSVNLLYGDSLTGTHANGPVALDVAAIAGLSVSQQTFAAISDTNNTSVMQGANGILGLGFPSGRCVLTQSLSARIPTLC
jgi:Eukaryotic aspartyl protease